MAIFPLSGLVKSCKVSPEVWLSALGQTSDPSLAWKERDVFKIKDDDDDADDDDKDEDDAKDVDADDDEVIFNLEFLGQKVKVIILT